MYASVNEMTSPAPVACGGKSEIEDNEALADSGNAAYSLVTSKDQSRHVELMREEFASTKRQLRSTVIQRDDARKALEAEKANRERLQEELDKAQTKIAVQSITIDSLTKQLKDAISFEEAVATMQEFTRCSVEDQRFKKYILRRACTHLESVWSETKKEYPGEDGISGVPALIPAFEVQRLVEEAVERIRKDAAHYKF